MFEFKLLNILIIVGVLTTKTTISFNIEDREPIAKIAPTGQEGSYFGFSVALHKETDDPRRNDQSWLLVGAPLGNNNQPGTNRSGALFKCPITDRHDDCEQVVTDGQRLIFDYDDNTDPTEKDPLSPPGVDEQKNGQWMGVTVKSQKPGGHVIVCAHRYVQSPNLNAYQYGYGLCYLMLPNLTVSSAIQPCLGRPVEELHRQFGFCQVGTSLEFFDDGYVAMGAPGPYTWRGAVFVRQLTDEFLKRDLSTYLSPLNNNPKPIDKYSYLGMSVTGGYFFHPEKFTYASGAPRSLMLGQVFFMNKTKPGEMSFNLVLTGEQFGSGFGYTVMADDLDRDGYDDLMVAAPFFYNETNGGAVYLYRNLRFCTEEDCPRQELFGLPKSRFGMAIAALGDINRDGYRDVAIGAPYEEVGDILGAVYIFLGTPKGLNPIPSQVLKPKLMPIKNRIQTFGYSLSAGIDMDQNGYPDLLVGAYASDKVFLYKTRPIIDIQIKLEDDEDLQKINPQKVCEEDSRSNNTCFNFKVCFKVGGLQRTFKRFFVNYILSEEVDLYKRIQFADEKYNSSARITVRTSNWDCRSEKVWLTSVSDYFSPIKFVAKYTLENTNPNSPILNKTSILKFEANFKKDCGDDGICTSELVLDATTKLPKNTVEDGFTVENITDNFILDLTIANKQEPAYKAQLYIIHPESLSYIALGNKTTGHVHCSVFNKTLISCDLGNPLDRQKTLLMSMRFEINSNTKEQRLNLHMFVNSTSTQAKNVPKQTSQDLVLILRKVAQFKLSGKATSNFFYAGKIIGESAVKTLDDIGTKVAHNFQIENQGDWTLTNVNFTIFLPYQVWQPTGSPGKWLLYLESIPTLADAEGSCTVHPQRAVNNLNLPKNLPLKPTEYSNISDFTVKPTKIWKGESQKRVVIMECVEDSAQCAIISCYIDRLDKGNSANINIQSRLWNSTLVKDYQNVDWVSIKVKAEVSLEADSAFVISNDTQPDITLETIAYPDVLAGDAVNWIWILVGVIVGLFVLVILSIVLWKCGFFKRDRIGMDQKSPNECKVLLKPSDEPDKT